MSEHEGKKPFNCTTCDKNFNAKGTLKKHITRVHEGNNSVYCPSCDKGFSHEDSLKRHILIVHDRKKPFKCNGFQANFG